MFMSKVSSNEKINKKAEKKDHKNKKEKKMKVAIYRAGHMKSLFDSMCKPVVVTTTDTKEGVVVKAAAQTDLKKTLQNALRSTGAGNARVWLWYLSGAATSGAATAQAPVNRIRPSDCAEFASWAFLYDEYKVLKCKTMYCHAISAGPSVATDMVMAYDPTNATVLAAIVEGAAAVHHKVTRNANSFSMPIPHGGVVSDGFFHLELKVPSGPQTESASGIPGPGVWIDTTVTAYDAGWFKSYITAASATVTTTLTQYIGILTEFRLRS
jgi:hypothetical protein